MPHFYHYITYLCFIYAKQDSIEARLSAVKEKIQILETQTVEITSDDVFLVQVAGLVHDLGITFSLLLFVHISTVVNTYIT